jgi:hypothetical protein
MKKNIPLTFLEALQPLIDKNLNLIEPVKEHDIIAHLKDKDPNSDFYFRVIKQENIDGFLKYSFEYKPKDKISVEKYGNSTSLEDLIKRFNNWVNIIESYNKIQTIYDDPIIKSNQERFENQFKIMDEDAEYSSFELARQLFLHEYLEDVKLKINEYKQDKSKEDIEFLNDLEKEVTDIQNDLTVETKNKIIKRLSKFWAKTQKFSLQLMKDIFVKIAAEISTKLLLGS